MPSFQFGIGERWALVSAVGYTAVGVMLRVAAPTIDPVLGSLLRLIPVTLIAVAILYRTGAREVRPSRPEYIGGRLILALFAAGFGSFVVKHRRAREGRNPKTGELVAVAAKKVPFFKVGKELKQRVDRHAHEAAAAGEPRRAMTGDSSGV